MIRARQHRQQGEKHGEKRMETGAQQPVRDPHIQAHEQNGRGRQDRIQPVKPMEQSKAALAKPGLWDPRFTSMSKTERVRFWELMRGKNPLADDDMPE
jgi:hypothetical protein